MVLRWCGVVGLGLGSALLLAGTTSASAQTVTPDSTVNTVVSTPVSGQFVITGGTIQGDNLFHSFDTFSPQNWATLFDLTDSSYGDRTAAISRIINRVTGGNASNIDGFLQVSGGNLPDLFLINPNGIIFGPNARLAVPGSFIASTAESLAFADGTTFAANDTTVNPLLTITAPIGLNLGASPAPIEVQGNGHNLTAADSLFSPTIPGTDLTGLLTATPGQTLGLLGGDLTLTGGTVTAIDGRVELGAVGNGDPTQVGLSFTPLGWQFDYAGVESFGDITLSERAAAYASGITTPGSMQLVGRQMTLADGSMALLQTLGPVPGGGLDAIASKGITVMGTTATDLLRSQIRTESLGAGQGADISIVTPHLRLQVGGRVEASSFADGGSGNLTIQAEDVVEITGFSPILPTIFSILTTATFGTGNAGDITIDTATLSLREGGSLSASTILGTGDGGNVLINASERVEVIGGSPFAPSGLDASSISSGNANSITVNTRQVVARGGGSIGTQAIASGSAGDVIIRASDFVEITGSLPIGPRISNSQIASSAVISPEVSEAFGFPSEPTGNSGSVDIQTPQLTLSQDGLVSVQNQGTGDSGNLQIAAEVILLDLGGGITASTTSGEGGNIGLHVQDLLALQNESLISAEAGGTGNGGNITLQAPFIIGVDNSDLIANAVFGNGGNIQIATQGIFGLEFREERTPDSDITASSQFGVSGTVTITDLEVDPRADAAELTTDFVDPSTMVAQSCGTQLAGDEFIVTGRGGVPPTPTALLASERTWQDVRDPLAYMDTVDSTDTRAMGGAIATPIATPATTPIAEGALVEINSWRQTPDGQMELIVISSTPVIRISPYGLHCQSLKYP
ncbi:MAG: filamentous hemagglutinin N-terminal domain-containing protein [Leptolyngbyaceae cyanobacterium]